MPPEMGGGSDRNAIPLYEVGNLEVVSNLLNDFPVRTSSLRTLGAHANVFALESFMDELAELAGADPLAFRLRHLKDARAAEVLNRAATLGGWPHGRSGVPGAALGLAFARYKNKAAYAAVVVEVALEEDIRVLGAWCAVDAGLAVNPDGVINQIEGGILQGLSWTLREAGRFEDGRATTIDWETYPIYRFADIPAVVRVEVIQRSGEASLGVGEASQGPAAAAVANALARASGMRFRHPPLNRERIAQEMTRA
jgi:CO/xanthine dehydrogenase Mo-binding subunit